MNWKKRLTNYNFWISLVSAVLLIFQAFNIKFDIVYINEIATAVLGLLVVIGIISDPTKVAVKEPIKQTEAKSEIIEIKTEEKKDEPVKEIEKVEEIPIETKDETSVNIGQDDLKVLIEKISADLHALTAKTEEANKSEIESLSNETIKEVEAKEVQTYNIVN